MYLAIVVIKLAAAVDLLYSLIPECLRTFFHISYDNGLLFAEIMHNIIALHNNAC